MKVVHTGVRLLTVMEDKQFSGYRLMQDGIDIADAFLPPRGGRRIHLGRAQYSDLVLLLEQEAPLVREMTPSTVEQWEKLSPGPILIDYRPNEGNLEEVRRVKVAAGFAVIATNQEDLDRDV